MAKLKDVVVDEDTTVVTPDIQGTQGRQYTHMSTHPRMPSIDTNLSP